jgi:hypothetical protein
VIAGSGWYTPGSTRLVEVSVPKRILITAGKVSAIAQLDSSPTAQAIWSALPIEASASRWGEEVYFEIPVRLDEGAGARQVMQVGELGYWPVGSAFCIFFGPTPASTGDEPRAYSNVNPFGRVEGDASVFAAVRSGTPVAVARAE